MNMKFKIVTLGIILIVTTCVGYGFINSKQESTRKCKNESVNGQSQVSWFRHADTKLPSVEAEFWYGIQRRHRKTVTMKKLKNATLIDDLIAYYPSNWIKNYVSVEIISIHHGKEKKAIGPNNVLNSAQKSLLNSTEISSQLIIKVNFEEKNNVTDSIHPGQMQVSMSIVPEKEAEFLGGYEKMINYFKKVGKDKLDLSKAKKIKIGPNNIEVAEPVSISFVVNELGETENIVIEKTSGDTKTDQFLIELIEKMPKWDPARDSKGKKVKQEFEFSVAEGNNKFGC